MMLRDAEEWLSTKNSAVNQSHSKTGATPLHVASSKGYIEVVKYVISCIFKYLLVIFKDKNLYKFILVMTIVWYF